MADYLPPSRKPQMQLVAPSKEFGDSPREKMADLKIFWGPEICRLEYLVHLLDTGRIKDEHWQNTA
ncbi:MAG TPA: hypothetical protein VIO57_04690 [Chloroflexota bacterium]